MIYLDNAATSYPKPQGVIKAMVRYMEEVGASPGRSGHRLAQKANRVIFEAREKLAQLLGVDGSERIVFTSNATEALNLAIKGLLEPGDEVIISPLEHHAVTRPLEGLKAHGVRTSIIPLTRDGSLDLDFLREAMKRKRPKLIITLHASNVSGQILPIEEVGRLARKHGVAYLVDASQTAGCVPVNLGELPVDLFAFPGHKALLGPMGTGGLYIREGFETMRPLKEGGTGGSSMSLLQPLEMPDRFESGTLNAPGIAGLSAAVDFILERGVEKIRLEEMELFEHLLEGLKNIKGMRFHVGGPGPRVPLVSFNLEGFEPGEVDYLLDREFGICVRSGLHCSPLAHKSLGTAPMGTVRLSLSSFNTHEEIHDTIKAIREISQQRGRFEKILEGSLHGAPSE